MNGWPILVISSIVGWMAYSGSCIVVLMDRRPILVFSSYIYEGWIMLHLIMCSSFIGRVAYIW